MDDAERIYKMANSPRWATRIKAASYGYNLDKLVTDDDYGVRLAVATQNFGLDVLINDPHPAVRKRVAQQGYGLETLIKDKELLVRKAAMKALAAFRQNAINEFGGLKPKSKKPRFFDNLPAHFEKDIPADRRTYTRAVKITYNDGDVVYLQITVPKTPTEKAYKHIEDYIKGNQPDDVVWE